MYSDLENQGEIREFSAGICWTPVVYAKTEIIMSQTLKAMVKISHPLGLCLVRQLIIFS